MYKYDSLDKNMSINVKYLQIGKIVNPWINDLEVCVWGSGTELMCFPLHRGCKLISVTKWNVRYRNIRRDGRIRLWAKKD